MDRLLAWSGGKDAAIALWEQDRRERRVDGLIATIGAETGRSSMHGIRPSLLASQAAALGLPIQFVTVPGDGTHASYRSAMQAAIETSGASRIVYGDVHLEDIRGFREDLLAEIDVRGEWPLWDVDPADLVRTGREIGVRATVVVADAGRVPPAILGRELAEVVPWLPPDVDVAGERGEYHTFVRDAPLFDRPISIRTGRRLTRRLEGASYQFVDLIPAASP